MTGVPADRGTIGRRGRPDTDAGIRIVRPAPDVDPLALWRVLPDEPAVLWRPPGGPAIAGAGVFRRVRLADPGDLRPLEAAWRAGADGTGGGTGTGGSEPGAGPAGSDVPDAGWIGGAAFPVPGSVDASEWDPLGPGCFLRPRWALVPTAAGVRLVLQVAGGADGPGRRQAWERRADALLASLAAATPLPESEPARITEVAEEPFGEWTERVERIGRRIAAGTVEKVVLGRRTVLRFESAPDPVAVLARLRRRQGDTSYVFGLRLGDRAFLGGSPERLLSLRGRILETEALAGTRRIDDAGLEPAVRALRASVKDRREQAIVARALRTALEPLADRLEAVDEEGAIRRLPGIVHLRTAIRAELRAEPSLAALVARIHPTPAVGGWPRQAALELVAREEAAARGWFAGCFGRVGPEGAELAVAIRSVLLADREAWAWAGAGIVEGSGPAAEYEETGDKLRTVLEALGAKEEA